MEGSKRIAAACGLAAVVCCLLWDGSVLAHPGIDEQIADVTARIAEDPKDAGLYLKRGELHRIHLDWAAAEADYLRARGLDPGLDAVDLGLGTLRLDAGKPAEALEALDRFLEQRPDHVRGLAARGRARMQLGKHLGAAADYTAAIEHSTSGKPRPGYYLERARALATAGDAHIPRAIAGLDEGLAQLGHPVTLQLLAIELELRRKRFDAALTRIDQIAGNSARKEPWLVRKAEVLESAGRSGEALQVYRTTLEAIDSLPQARRHNRAVERLERQARDAIERLTAKPESG